MYRLIHEVAEPRPAPLLDAAQRAVVDHAGGPLLVLAGPGTGKTTTLVEAVVDRIERRGATPDSILVLTFSRKAAADLRMRIAARLGRTVITPVAMTFHAFCYALVRRFAPTEGFASPIRLLTGPEQEFRVRETLLGTLETRRTEWPSTLARAFPTRAFAGEVRAVLAKARQLGMDPEDVIAAGRAAGRDEWVSVGEFFDEYLDVLDAEGVLDYAELVHRCRILLTDPQVVQTLRREIGEVFVDEYQDTDPSQVRLLQAIAGDGRDVVVVGDPDQSIYAFRGAAARGILDFPEMFRTADGAPAPILALDTTRRFGRNLLVATRNVADRLSMARALPPEVFAKFRQPRADPALPKGQVEVYTCSSVGAEAEHIAEILRSAHLRDGVSWDEMAVLVRAGRATIPGLTRALVAAGVPVEVAGDEIPLATDPAARPLLLGLQVASRSTAITADEALLLLTSPMGGLDSMAIRRLGRALRDAERAELAGSSMPRPSVGADRRGHPAAGPARGLSAGDSGRSGPAAGRTAAAGDPGDPGGQHGRGGAVGAVVGYRVAGATAGRGGPGWRGRPPGQPRSRCRVRPVRDRRPIGGGLRAPWGDRLSGRGRGPADPGGHAPRVRPPGVGGPGAHRPPGQGAGVGARRGRRSPGRALAGRTPSRLAARAGPARHP